MTFMAQSFIRQLFPDHGSPSVSSPNTKQVTPEVTGKMVSDPSNSLLLSRKQQATKTIPLCKKYALLALFFLISFCSVFLGIVLKEKL